MHVDHDGPVADITLERYRLNELPADVTARLERRLRDDDRLRRRLDALSVSDQQIQSSEGLELVAVRVRQRLATRDTNAERPAWWAVSRWAVPAAVAAGIALVLVLPHWRSMPIEDDERIKGLQASLVLFRQVGAGSETLADGAVAHRGDVIRVGYRARGRAYGVIMSIDGRGHVTVHLPSAGDRAVPLARDTTVLLDQAYELDDAPRWERFYFVTANEPFMVAPLVRSAHRAVALARGDTPADLTLSPGLEQSVVSLQKESKP
jgi:hypothetical protein